MEFKGRVCPLNPAKLRIICPMNRGMSTVVTSWIMVPTRGTIVV
jgi:hypothetical protein